MVIRPATVADMEGVRMLLGAAWHQVYDPIIGPDAVAEIIARWHAPALLTEQLTQPRSSFLVACEDEVPVGHGFAYMREPDTLVVSRLYVHPSHQRHGVGRRLLDALRARHEEATSLCLFTAAENLLAVSFYRGEGFTVVREGIEEGVRVLHMEKRLG